MCKETKNTSTGAVRSCSAKTAGSSRRRASGLRQDVGRARLARPACGSLSLGRGEQLLQQAWTRPALGAPAAHDLHQALPFPSHPVSERLFSLAAKPEACRAQRKAVAVPTAMRESAQSTRAQRGRRPARQTQPRGVRCLGTPVGGPLSLP